MLDGQAETHVNEKGKKKEKKKKTRSGQVEQEEESTGGSSVLLRGIFKLGKISHDVLLTSSTVSWTTITPDNPTGQQTSVNGSVSLKDVFAVKVKKRRGVGQQTGGAVQGLCLFCSRRRGHMLKEVKVHLLNTSVSLCQTWYSTLRQLLTAFTGRPRQLKVFINPGSHKKQAVHIYRDHVAPLFKMADIQTDITITEGKGHILSVVKECSLEKYDGVVCVGGDGTVAELAHALVLRTQIDHHRDPDCVLNPVQATLPLGIIPAGSTDIVSCSVHGVRHPVTAGLHIILGHLQEVDMCSFSSLGRLVTFGFSAMFGFGGRSLALAERMRWMSPSQRRDYAVIKTLASLRPEECQLSFLSSNTTNEKELDSCSETEGDSSWTITQGVYLSVIIGAIPSLSPHAPRGLAPNTRLTNGSAELITVGNVSRSEFIKHLKRYNNPDEQSCFSFVETHSVQALKLHPRSLVDCPVEEEDHSTSLPIVQSESPFPWNIDGELVEMAYEVLVRVHPRLITLYGEEVEQVDGASVSCSCI